MIISFQLSEEGQSGMTLQQEQVGTENVMELEHLTEQYYMISCPAATRNWI